MKTISYNEKNLNVILGKNELNIPVGIYIEIEENPYLIDMLKIIYLFDYVLFAHLYRYFKRRYGLSKTATFERIQQLETYNMIKTDYLNNNKYAMLTKKGITCIFKNNNISQKRKPNAENLKKAVYISEYFLYFGQKLKPFSSLKKYNEMYKKVYEVLSKERTFDYKQPDEDFKKFARDHGKGLRHIQLREKAEYSLAKWGDLLYFSSKDYIEKEISYLNEYMNKSRKERRTSERDELSTMQNQYLYYMFIENDNVLKFIMLDMGRSKNFYRETLLHLDRIVRRMHQYIIKQYYNWEVTILTDSINRKHELEKHISEIKKEYLKHKKNAIYEDMSNHQMIRNRVQYRKAAFFMKDIKINLLDISKYFKSVVRDPELPIQENQIDIRKL